MFEAPPKIARISGKFEYPDGSSHEFLLSQDGAWQQWGATPTEMVERGTSELLDAFAQAAADWILSSDDEYDDEEKPEPRTSENCAYPHDTEGAHDHADCEDTLAEAGGGPDRFAHALRAAKIAASGDSNDEEIEALWDALRMAADLLGVPEPDVDDDQEDV